MNIKQQLRNNFPRTINKTKPVFCALIANDKGDAAIEAALTQTVGYMNEYKDSKDIYAQAEELLDKTIEFFSYFSRYTDESDESLKSRFAAIFVRNHNQVWGTINNIKGVFTQYFPSAKIYIVENTNSISENLVMDFDFLNPKDTPWKLEKCNFDYDARFSDHYGINLKEAGAYVSQSLHLNKNAAYYLHFFLKGKVKVKIQSSDGTYWNDSEKSWTATEESIIFNAEEWSNKDFWFTSNTEEINLYFEYADENGYIDYIRVFEKKLYPTFSVLVHFTGSTSRNVIFLADGNAESKGKLDSDVDPYSYFDTHYLSGAKSGYAMDLYNEILELVKPCGVKAYIEILNKDE